MGGAERRSGSGERLGAADLCVSRGVRLVGAGEAECDSRSNVFTACGACSSSPSRFRFSGRASLSLVQVAGGANAGCMYVTGWLYIGHGDTA